MDAATAQYRDKSSVYWLLVWGGGGLVNYGILAHLGQRFVFGVGHTERPILQVVSVLVAAWVAWLGACYVVLRRIRPASDSSEGARREVWPLAIVLMFALAYRLVLIPSRPIQEADLYRYLWDGLLTVNGINPYRATPAELAERMARAYREWQQHQRVVQDELVERLSQMLSEPQVHNRRLMELALAHHGRMPTTYPPVAQAVFALVAGLCPDTWSVQERVTLLKAVLVAFDLGTLVLLLRLLQHVGWPLSWCVVYAWCPLVCKEVANSGHVDSVAVFFCTLAWWQLLRRRWGWAGCAWALAVASKVYPLALVPLLVGWVAHRGGAKALGQFFGVGLVVVAVSFGIALPSSSARGPGTGLAIFLREWEMNDFLFSQTKRLLDWCVPAGWQERLTSWPNWPRRVATGDAEQEWLALTQWVAFGGSAAATEAQRLGLLPVSPAFVLAYLLHAVVYGGLVTGLTWRAVRADLSPWRNRSTPGLPRNISQAQESHQDVVWLRTTFLALAWLFLLLPTENPWYFLWALPWLVWSRQYAWYLLPGLLAQYYLYFWFVYHFPLGGPGVANSGMPGYRFFHQVWVWVEYVPFFTVLLGEWLWARKHWCVSRHTASAKPSRTA